MILILVSLFVTEVVGLVIETKLDLPDPPAITGPNGEPVSIDSSLSPKIVKAFYEINFVPDTKPERNKPFVSISNSKGCPYSADLCKYYFAPSKISTVQRVEDMIEKAKKDSNIPIVEGLSVPDEEKLLKEFNSTIMAKVNKIVSLKKKESSEVPVYRGTVNVDQVLKRPEVSTLPEYRPHWPEIRRNCLQGPCHWRNTYQEPSQINSHL